MKKDFEVLEELLNTVEQLGQRTGTEPGLDHLPSYGELQKDLEEYRDDCEHDRLEGRARRRRSGELLRRIISIDPKIWTG